MVDRYVDKMLAVLDPPDLEWFQPFIESRKPALRKLCKMLVNQNMMWEEQVSVPASRTSFRYWRTHCLLTNQLRFMCSYMAQHNLVGHAKETETMRRAAFSDYYDRRVTVDWDKASADYAPQVRLEVACELDNLIAAMKIWADSPYFETDRRWLYHVTELFDLNSLTKGEFASLTEALDRVLVRYERFQSRTKTLDDYMLSPAVRAASTLMNVHFASNTWPLARKYNQAVIKLIKTAHENRELSESEQSHLDQAKMCSAFEAFHCGRKSEAETKFRQSLETSNTNPSNLAVAAAHTKIRHMNVYGLLMCRIEHPRSTREEIEELAAELEVATKDFYESSRACGQAAGFEDDNTALEKTTPAWREYWSWYKGFLDSARQGAVRSRLFFFCCQRFLADPIQAYRYGDFASTIEEYYLSSRLQPVQKASFTTGQNPLLARGDVKVRHTGRQGKHQRRIPQRAHTFHGHKQCRNPSRLA